MMRLNFKRISIIYIANVSKIKIFVRTVYMRNWYIILVVVSIQHIDALVLNTLYIHTTK